MPPFLRYLRGEREAFQNMTYVNVMREFLLTEYPAIVTFAESVPCEIQKFLRRVYECTDMDTENVSFGTLKRQNDLLSQFSKFHMNK